MKRFGGFGGGMGNMQQLMKQAQEMQKKLAEAQAEIETLEIEGQSGGGMVKLVIDGNKNLKSIEIDPAVCDPEDIEMLEDLIVAAFNEAGQKADEIKKEKMGAFGELGI